MGFTHTGSYVGSTVRESMTGEAVRDNAATAPEVNLVPSVWIIRVL